MDRMMNNLIILCYLLFSNISYRHEVDMTPAMLMLKQLELLISEEFVYPGRKLPDSLDEIEGLRKYVKNSPKAISEVNKFMMIPGSPVIQHDSRIQQSLLGNRILIAPRLASMRSDELGRIVLCVLKDSSITSPLWIPEPQFQCILKQLKDFDPDKQPLAFQDLVQGSIKTLPAQRDLNRHQNPSVHSQIPHSPESPSFIRTFKERDEYFLLWIVVGITVLVVGSGYAIRRARR